MKNYKKLFIVKEFKGTKGKWVWVNDNLKNDEGKLVITHPNLTSQTEKANANAKLIAAAPDLLEALQKVKELHKKHYKFHSIGQGFIEEADEVIQKAINKALD